MIFEKTKYKGWQQISLKYKDCCNVKDLCYSYFRNTCDFGHPFLLHCTTLMWDISCCNWGIQNNAYAKILQGVADKIIYGLSLQIRLFALRIVHATCSFQTKMQDINAIKRSSSYKHLQCSYEKTQQISWMLHKSRPHCFQAKTLQTTFVKHEQDDLWKKCNLKSIAYQIRD